jgi:hypothetical protein
MIKVGSKVRFKSFIFLGGIEAPIPGGGATFK